MKEKILNEISDFCSTECGNLNNCADDGCVLYRIEKIVEPEIKEFEIEIEEILQKVVKVKATNEEDAIAIVRQKYKNTEIVLDSESFMDYDIHLFNRGE